MPVTQAALLESSVGLLWDFVAGEKTKLMAKGEGVGESRLQRTKFHPPCTNCSLYSQITLQIPLCHTHLRPCRIKTVHSYLWAGATC